MTLTTEEPEAVTTLDLSLGEEECARVMREAAMRGTGFFFLEGHGIPQDVLDGAFESHATFFGKSKSFKNRFRAKSNFQEPLGYKDAQVDMITVEKESQSAPDFREHMRVARKKYAANLHEMAANDGRVACEVPATGGHPEEEGNQVVWLDEVNGFGRRGDLEAEKESIGVFYREAFKISRRVHRVAALSLGLPADDFDRFFRNPLDILMMNHYPSMPGRQVASEQDEERVSMGAHCDFAFTTLLLTDGTPGLQVCKDKTKSVGEREWVSVPAQKKGTFVINFGDVLELLSNGKYTSVLHRVVNTSGQERKSIAFFCEPSADARISPILAAGEKAKYGVVENYADYQASKFASISENIDGTD